MSRFNVGDIVRCLRHEAQFPEDAKHLVIGKEYEVVEVDYGGDAIRLKGVYVYGYYPYLWMSRKFEVVRTAKQDRNMWTSDDLWDVAIGVT